MKQLNFKGLLGAIIFCLLILLCLQWYWLVKLKHWQEIEFNKTINLALNKTLSDERKQRTDSISKGVYRWMMDTSLTSITSKIGPGYTNTIYFISDKRGPIKQNSSFSLTYENRPVTTKNDSVRKVIANYIVNKFRESYREYDAIFFDTKTIGDSASFLSGKLRLDTSRLRQIFASNLRQQSIETSFALHFIKLSDTLLGNKMTDEGNNLTSLQTNLYKTDVYNNGEIMYTYAVFKKPLDWLYGKLLIPLLLSFLVLAAVSGLLFYSYRIINRQKQLSSIKNDFIDNMTHELKTPISIITASAEAMQQFGILKDEAKTQKYITTIRSYSEQLHIIINKVLDISSFEKQEIRLSKTRINFRELISEITNGHILISSDVEIITYIESPTGVLYGDRFHLKNIFFNIIDNALKYNGSKAAIIHITMKEKGNNQVITVQDNGKGVDSRYLETIFDKFFRIPQGNNHKVKGFGLGLFYAKKIINLHGGNIYAESNTGSGTIFTIILPK